MDEVITEAAIQAVLKTRTFGRVIYCLEELDSTNRFAKKVATTGRPEGTLVYAEKQTQGRGRWGRVWDSAAGKGLWFSVVLCPRLEPSSVALLTMLGTTVIARVVEKELGLSVKVRWPNDLLLNGRKVGGVLTEVSRGEVGIKTAVLGMGLNVNQEAEDFSPDVRERAVSLRMVYGRRVDRLSLLASVLLQLENDYRESLNLGFDSVLRRWVFRSSILGHEILLRLNGHTVEGVVKGFHKDGSLVLVTGKGEERRYAEGDVVEVRDVTRR